MTTLFQVQMYDEHSQLSDLLTNDDYKEIHEDELVEGAVVSIDNGSVYVDLAPYGMGIIYGREYINAKDIIKNLNIGDPIKGKIIERENDDGYVELSLKEARAALLWKDADEAVRNKTIFNLPVKAANKGGLIVTWQGIDGFLPASQLKAEHYPRVEDGDKDAILKELKKLVGEIIPVMMISTNPKEGKLIFSEKGEDSTKKIEIMSKYAVGDELDCVVSGAVDFGLFLRIEDGLEGLVHISEIDWSLVESPKDLYNVGDKARAKVIEIKGDKISLSIKALKENPWQAASEKYPKDTEVEGVVMKYNKHGAIISIAEGISGLIHISEFEDETDLKNTLEIGKLYTFRINLFKPQEQRMALSHVK